MTPAPDALKFIDPSKVYGPLMRAYMRVLTDCASEGAIFYATSGLRTAKEQAELYEQGRTTPGPHAGEPNYGRLGLSVTNARAWQSAHNYGLAIDSTRDGDLDRRGLQPDWNLEHYEVLGRNAKKHGLDAAFYWNTMREGPHVQVDLARFGLSLKHLFVLQQKYRGRQEDVVAAVWTLLDDRGAGK